MPEPGESGGPGGPGGPLPPPQYFSDQLLNPIPTGEGRLSPTITTGIPKVFHLSASLDWFNKTFNKIAVEYC